MAHDFRGYTLSSISYNLFNLFTLLIIYPIQISLLVPSSAHTFLYRRHLEHSTPCLALASAIHMFVQCFSPQPSKFLLLRHVSLRLRMYPPSDRRAPALVGSIVARMLTPSDTVSNPVLIIIPCGPVIMDKFPISGRHCQR